MVEHKRDDFSSFKRIVIKLGTSSINYANGKTNLFQVECLVRQMADLANQGNEVVLVTSGAVGAGAGKLGVVRSKSIPLKQALAAVGQGVLMHIYEKLFAEYGLTVGQILLTREDFAERRRFLNARNTLHILLRLGVIPIINENDTVAVDELKLGDNDNLSALVASLVDAEMLFLLSDVDGLYTADPRKDPHATLLHDVTEVSAAVENQAGGAGSEAGTGGMATKLQAAKVAMHSGVVTVIANSNDRNIIRRIIGGEELGTVFWPLPHKFEKKKNWIAYCAAVCGRIHVDAGAARALTESGKSLLPSGITRVEGVFEIGNTVSMVDPQGQEIARGLTNYNSEEVERIKGLQTSAIKNMLGHKDYNEVVHRNNLVINT